MADETEGADAAEAVEATPRVLKRPLKRQKKHRLIKAGVNRSTTMLHEN